MKKTIILLTVLALAVCTLFASGASESKKTSSDTVELVVAWWGSQTRNEKFIAALDRYMELNPNVKIETQTNGFNDHMISLAASAASGTLPDVSMSQSAYMAQYVDAGQLLDFTPYFGNLFDRSNISDAVLDTAKFGDGIYGITAGVNALALVYNKTLTDSLGITVKDYMTLDDFMDISREIYKKTGVKTAFAYNQAQYIEYLVRAEGYVLFGEDSLGVPSYEALLPYFEMIETGRNEGWLIDPSIIVGAGSSMSLDPLTVFTTPDTQSWMTVVNSNQLVSVAQDKPEGMELAITTRPTPDASKSLYLRQAMCWTVSANSKNIEESVKLVNWLTNSEEANAIIMAEPGVPASSTMTNYVAGLVGENEKKAMDFINDVVTPLATAPNPNAGAGASQIQDGLIPELDELVQYGELSAVDAAKRLFNEGNQMMADAASRNN